MTEITIVKLRNYYYGRLDHETECAVRAWLTRHTDTREADELLSTLLDEIHVEAPAQAQAAFERFRRRITRMEELDTRIAQASISPDIPFAQSELPEQHPEGNAVRRRRPAVWLQRIAAVLIVPLLVAAAWFYYRAGQAPEWQEIIVPAGERSELVLADGTRLYLNAGSRVTYPNRFNGRQRKIFIDGEIFAEVAHDPKHPFIISAGDAEVEVLGTKFNMRAYQADPLLEVALVEGSVRFGVKSPKCNNQLVMLPNDVVHYDRLTGRLERTSFQADSYKARACGGGFYFFNESLESIVAQLARSFDRRIVITDPELSDTRFYAFFTNNESLLKILSTLNADGFMTIRPHDQVIYISKNTRNRQ